MGHMIVSGVFERHPDLKFVITETSNAAAIAGYIAKIDGLLQFGLGLGTSMYEHIQGAADALCRTASEYFTSNCYVGARTICASPATRVS